MLCSNYEHTNAIIGVFTMFLFSNVENWSGDSYAYYKYTFYLRYNRKRHPVLNDHGMNVFMAEVDGSFAFVYEIEKLEDLQKQSHRPKILLKKSLFYLYTPISVKVTDTGAGKVTIRIVIMEVKLVLALVFCTCVWLSDGYNIDYLRASRILEKYAKSLEENAEKKGKSYRAQLQGDLCNFSTYDIDQDGVIEKDELLTISAGNDAVLAVLDLMADNKSVMPEEFYALVPMFIPECPDSDQK